MSNVLVGTEVEVYTSRQADPNDEWDAGDTEGHVSNVWACYTEHPQCRNWSDSIIVEVPDDFNGTLFAVVADYSSGSTFGRDGGHCQVLDAFVDDEKAEALAKIALESVRDGWRVSYDYCFVFEGKEYHRAWAGWFEELNSVDVWEITVRSNAIDPYRDIDEYYENTYPGVNTRRKVGH